MFEKSLYKVLAVFAFFSIHNVSAFFGDFGVCRTKGPGAKCHSEYDALRCLKTKYPHFYDDVSRASLSKGPIAFLLKENHLITMQNSVMKYNIEMNDPSCLSRLNHQELNMDNGVENLRPYKNFYNGNETSIHNNDLIQCDDVQFNTEYWMQDLAPYIQGKSITEISMPGSHDSGTSMISYDSYIAPGEALPDKLNILRKIGIGFAVNKIIANWGKAQSLSIKEQLEAGIRYLDLRLLKNPESGKYWTVHGLYGEPLEPILLQVRDFLRKHTNEIIILDLQSIDTQYTQELHQTMTRILSEFNFAGEDDLNTPIGELITKGLNIFVFVKDDIRLDEMKNDFNFQIISREKLDSFWPNASSLEEFEEKMIPYFNTFKKRDLTIIQAQLTPDTNMIMDGILHPLSSPSNLEDVSMRWNSYIFQYASRWLSITRGGIIIADFVTPELSRQVILQNISPANKPCIRR